MDGSITLVVLNDGSRRYRARYRDAGAPQHEKRFARKVDAQRWLDEATSALVTQTWTAPERGRVTGLFDLEGERRHDLDLIAAWG